MVSVLQKRMVHLIRHAESRYNVETNGLLEGFARNITFLDADLSRTGHQQGELLRQRILESDADEQYSIRNAQLIITSPLQRAIRTAQYAFDAEEYQFVIVPHVCEQIENTSDIGRCKNDLTQDFPHLQPQIARLPDVWWHRHPEFDEYHPCSPDPNFDAHLLFKYEGREPAAESKYLVRERLHEFFDWLYNNEQTRHCDNIAIVSHSCTIFEMERIITGNEWNDNTGLTMTKNTEIRSHLVHTTALFDYFNSDHCHKNGGGADNGHEIENDTQEQSHSHPGQHHHQQQTP